MGAAGALIAGVQPLTQFLAAFEKRHLLGLYGHGFTGSGIPPDTRVSTPSRKGAKAAQFDAVSLCKGIRDFIENRIHDTLDITRIEVWIPIRQPLDKF
jgi:hypothetical protein